MESESMHDATVNLTFWYHYLILSLGIHTSIFFKQSDHSIYDIFETFSRPININLQNNF